MSKGLGYALLSAGLAIGIGSSANARTLEVYNTSPCLTGQHTTYSTIQTAVQAASAGDIVDVCPGSYPEQVTISNAITLAGVIVHSGGQTLYPIITVPSGGVVANAASIDPSNPNFPIAAQILVEQGNLASPPAVTIKNRQQ
jgi:pectin methylesterase-like acyl-CoA thioesterase